MCYFSHVFQYPKATIDAICHALKDPKFGHIDFVVGAGLSGTFALASVSIQSGIPCATVRQRNFSSHSIRAVETWNSYSVKIHRYIILDDLIEGGGTIRRVREVMSETYKHCRCVGIVLYQDKSGGSNRDIKSYDRIPVTCLDDDIVELAKMMKEEPEISRDPHARYLHV